MLIALRIQIFLIKLNNSLFLFNIDKVNTATKPNKSLSKSSSKAKNFKNPSKSKK